MKKLKKRNTTKEIKIQRKIKLKKIKERKITEIC